MNRVVVVAPHADDEIIGCGATIARHIKSGDEVTVVIATNASIGAPELFTASQIKNVRSEAIAAHQFLGVKETIFLEFPAPALNSFPEFKISLELSEIFQRIKPTHLYIPHPGDIHQDHKAIYRASLVAARPQGENKISNIYCYETLSETEWTPMQEKAFVPNHFVNVTDVFSKKTEAMNFFGSQIKKFPHSRSIEAFEALAMYRGATVGVERAEAFSVERQLVI
ncbi:PIG-L domain-containing protein [Chryseobacterium lactis]|uniref:PIG-L domain-containing protein n=1 Tax=Chryseobacterium lactis TaxID=1241981 RepID=A0A3G6RKJ6_CHRLC|nr:PIG-L deacetylase family protein [Chryseobacterium lactis]AZA85007.1 PIG-L family deacetylase [Chryseobacterium lactis]AZB05395.1 PIG-L family deacetylase [Chryseobacterium lactis]PNW11544.1 PIG-L domain-containing protein [Chryseobacterium lactis]